MVDDNKYFSMMGLIKKEHLASNYNDNTWKEFDDLQQVLDMMEKCETGGEDKHSIPDVYGRLLQFGIALDNIKVNGQAYNYTKEILNWRGILAAIALQDFLGFTMKVEALHYLSNGTAFDEALKYFPNSSLYNVSNAKGNITYYILMIKGENKPEFVDIALFSPITLFFPVADIEKKIPCLKKMNWFDTENREFLDPAKKLTKTEKLIVRFWIMYLVENVTKMVNAKKLPNSKSVQTVLNHLEKFKKDLEQGLSNEDWLQKRCFEPKVCGNEIQNDLASFVFNYTVKVGISFEEKYISYNELFASRIYYTCAQSSPFIGCSFTTQHKVAGNVMEDEGVYALIPFGKKVSTEWSRDTINKLMNCLNMTLVKSDNNTGAYIKVTLTLTEISKSYIDLEKYYSIEDGSEQCIKENDFPMIAIWPSNNINVWKTYFVYLEAGYNNNGVKINNDNEKIGCNPFVKAYDGYPTAISLKSSLKGKDYDIGMLLPDFQIQEKVKAASILATVGIDFGTSGTMVYVKRNDNGEWFPVKFLEDTSKLLTCNRSNYDIEQGINNINLEYMNNYFIANNVNGNSLYSVYRRPTKEMLQSVSPILDGIIYQAAEGDMLFNSEQYMSDIKWDNPNNGVYYAAFIKELCMHVCGQLQKMGITTVEWRYALPESLHNKDTIHTIWKSDIMPFLKSNIQISHSVSSKEYSESEATSVYFLNADEMNKVNKDKGFLVVDIGGGSSDIAVWQKKESQQNVTMVTQISVPVAGRILFTRYVALRLNDIKDQVFHNDDEIKEELEKLQELNAKGDNQKICNAILERVVQNNKDIIKRTYNQHPQWAKNLKTHLEFGVAMLFFSLGSLAGYLQKKGFLQTKGIKGSFSIAFGGNGSKILEWMEDDLIKFEYMFKSGIECRNLNSNEYEPKIIISKKPKREVAYGLIQDEINQILREENDARENITNELALHWNNEFLNNYNKFFDQEIKLEENDFFAVMSSVNRNTDICNFFMNDMYMKYYKNRIGQLI